MLSYRVTFTGAAPMELAGAVTKQVMPLLHQAVRAVAKHTAANWQEAVYKAKLWSGEKDEYAESIQWEMTGDFSALVFTEYKHAAEIETGRPARDLKKMLDASLKVRRTDGGKRFLVIPLRHNTPGHGAHAKAMSPAVYDLAKAMKPSRVVATGERPSGQVTVLSPKTGMHASPKQSPFLSNPKTQQASMVASRKYSWGGRLSGAALKAAGVDPAEAKRYKGMVKMQTTTPGGKKSSAYMTFRIMMDSQTGKWIIPAQPGMYLARDVAQAMQPKAEQAFAAAVKKTMGA